MARYYIDTCVWRDYYEDRVGPGGRPLGEHATRMLIRIIGNKEIIILSDVVMRELKGFYSSDEIELMLGTILKVGKVIKIEVKTEETTEASILSKSRRLPILDAMHAIIARNNNAVLISQDKHFQNLKDIVKVIRPDELI